MARSLFPNTYFHEFNRKLGVSDLKGGIREWLNDEGYRDAYRIAFIRWVYSYGLAPKPGTATGRSRKKHHENAYNAFVRAYKFERNECYDSEREAADKATIASAYAFFMEQYKEERISTCPFEQDLPSC